MPAKCLDAGVLSKIKQERSEAFLIKLIDLFLKDGPMRIQEAWDGGRTKDLKKVALAAHILRCLAENIGAVSIRDLAATAESAASGGKEAAVFLSHILFDLEIAFADTRACLLIARQGIAENP
ncbi:MAG TPA: Hpt domain-containing protein [Fibrobacteria bacterium]|nr:Hpt domain-containing protein [Fibrobacteria bacterium]